MFCSLYLTVHVYPSRKVGIWYLKRLLLGSRCIIWFYFGYIYSCRDRFPIGRKQHINFFFRCIKQLRQPDQYIFDIPKRLDVIQQAGFKNGIDHSTAFGRLVVSGEEPIFASQSPPAKSTFNGIIQTFG